MSENDLKTEKVAKYNLSSPEALENPYPQYHQMRAEDPVYFHPTQRLWVLTRYSDIVAVLSDPRFASSQDRSQFMPQAVREQLRPLLSMLALQMPFLDPPAHTRIRTLVNKAFTPRVVEGMRARIQDITDTLLDKVQQNPDRSFEIIQELAFPLPITVIMELLGIPLADRDQLKKWSYNLTLFLGGVNTPQQMRLALQSQAEIQAYFQTLVAQLRQHPVENSLLSSLATVEEAGQRLRDEELYANCVLLLAAGHETTTNLIGNGILALLQHPDQLALLRQNPALITSAVEEFLRFDSPVQGTSRFPKEAVEIGGKQISEGQRVLLLLGAANRDPAQFNNPDRLDITRRDNRHLAFSHGLHYCLGAALARIEGQIAINSVIERFADLCFDEARPVERQQTSFRGLKALPLKF